MLYQLGPLFKTQFREAESNDTRQYIPHEERDNPERNKDNTSQDPDANKPWTDNASVGIKALRAFLIDFLKTLPGDDNDEFLKDHAIQKSAHARPKENKRPSNTQNARAVRAYQTMASHGTPVESKKEEETLKKDKPKTKIPESKELRDIYTLIIDLENLENNGITVLNIMKAGSFVESLKQAVVLANKR